MNKSIQTYTKERETFLQAIVEQLSTDERFVAAWLTGSFARGEQDTLSDIDITLVVADEYCQTLCARPKMVSAQTTKERYDLFRLFGQPALIHENNNNAPAGGTFTFIAYDQTAMMVDWVLRPLSGASRSEPVLLLFDKVNIPTQSPAEPASQEQRAEEASEVMAFFWMMTAITVKYISRGDDMFVNTWLEELTKIVFKVERLIKGQAWHYKRGSHMELKTTADEQITAIRLLCERMENLKPELASLGGYVPKSPMTTIETLIRVGQEKIGIQ
jgi:predicted nucleotidyltransferase